MRLRFIAGLLTAVALLADDAEVGRVVRNGQEAVLTVEGPRPVDAAVLTLAKEFGVAVNVEDPTYLFPGDLQAGPGKLRIPKGGSLEIRFPLHPDGSPRDLAGLLQDLVAAADRAFSFGYRIDQDGDRFSLVPTRTRDREGRVIAVTPLLDRRVTIPAGTRTVAASAALMTEALSAQTGMHVHCCQGVVGGIPWGLRETSFAANDEPARSVLKRLLAAAEPQWHSRMFWFERCDGQPSGWCFINLTHARRPVDDWGRLKD